MLVEHAGHVGQEDELVGPERPALKADELVFLSDVPGVLDEQGAVLPQISASCPPASASGGMLPKLEACTTALLGGVARVSIGVAGMVVTP